MIHYALAQSQAQQVAQGFLMKLNEAIFYPLLTLMMAVALLIFLFGAFEYVKNSGSEQGREQGRRHLLWGVIGMLVMLSAYAILTIAAATFELDDELRDATTRPDSTAFIPSTSESTETDATATTESEETSDPEDDLLTELRAAGASLAEARVTAMTIGTTENRRTAIGDNHDLGYISDATRDRLLAAL